MTFKEFSIANHLRLESPEGYNCPINARTPADWLAYLIADVGQVARHLDSDRVGAALAAVLIGLDLLAQREGVELEDEVIKCFNEQSKRLGYSARLASEEGEACLAFYDELAKRVDPIPVEPEPEPEPEPKHGDVMASRVRKVEALMADGHDRSIREIAGLLDLDYGKTYQAYRAYKKSLKN